MITSLVGATSPGSAAAQAPGSFTFTGSGWGHGVGMSQYGARAMAADGHSHAAILGHYYGGTELAVLPTVENVRVHLADSADLTLSSVGSIAFDQGGAHLTGVIEGSQRVYVHDGGLQIGPVWTAATNDNPVIVSFPKPVQVSTTGHSYLWGKLQLTVHNNKVRVVESGLSMENYVAGIAEMPSSWPAEALQAQAIAARTYALEVTLDRRGAVGWQNAYDISATTTDQHYIGYSAQDDSWDEAWVAAQAATAGVVISYAGAPIRAYYSASSGGHTETAAFVFSNDQPYAPGVPDPYDAVDNDWSSWTRTYSTTDLSRWLNRAPGTNLGEVTSISVGGFLGISGRTDKSPVTVTGTQGTLETNGRRLMLLINAGVLGEGGGLARHLPGTLFQVEGGSGSAAAPAAVSPRTDIPAPVEVPIANISVINDVRGVPLLPQRPARLTNEPFGLIDSIEAIDGRIAISGWAIDPDAGEKTVTMDVYLDGIRYASFQAERERSDLGEHFPSAGANHAFNEHLEVGGGDWRVCVMARDANGRSDTQFACGDIAILGSATF